MNDSDTIWTDPADSPASSYMPDTDALDSLDDHRLEAIQQALRKHNGQPSISISRAILSRLKPIENDWHTRESRTEQSVYVVGLLTRIIEAKNAKLEAMSLAHASGLPQFQAISLTETAKNCGVSKQAFSKRVLKLRQTRHLPNLPGRKSDKARATYQATQTERSKPCNLQLWN
jgi:hypothetical protein